MDSARVYAERSIGYSKKYNALDNEANAIKIIMRTDSVHGNMGEYIRHRDKYDSLFKEIRGNEMARHVAVIKEQHKFDLLKKDALRRHYVSMLWLGVLSAGLIVLAVVIYLLYKQTLTRQKMAEMERQRLDAEVEHKRMENELLQLKMQQADEELTRAYQNNIAMTRRLAAKDNQPQELTRLEQMEQTMEQTQATFLAHVQKLYPQLTHNDMLIMGFIRMGMTMQEIAAAMGVSVDSISKAATACAKSSTWTAWRHSTISLHR